MAVSSAPSPGAPLAGPGAARRLRRLGLALASWALLAALPALAAHEPPRTKELPPLEPASRLLVIAPHPDDESIGAAGLLARAVRLRIPVKVVFLTSGDGYPDALRAAGRSAPAAEDFVRLGEQRQREALDALATLGVTRSDVVFLGYPDGGLESLWRTHWSPGRPYRSPFTARDRAPYPDSLERGAPYTGAQLVGLVENVVATFRPNRIVLSHPGDVHPDHAAAAEIAIEAIDNLERRGRLPRGASVLAYLVHNPMWPDGDERRREMVPPRPEWLAATGPWWTLRLTDEELRRKTQALRAYGTQARVLSDLLRRFLRANEIFAEITPGERGRIAARH